MARYYKLTERGKNFLESGLIVDGGFEDSRLMQLLILLGQGPIKLETLEEKIYSRPPSNNPHGFFRRLINKAVQNGYIVFAGKEPVKLEIERQKKRHNVRKPLENEARKRIYDYIIEHPGTHYNKICRTLTMNNGTVDCHIQVLLEFKLIEYVKAGKYLRFYSRGCGPTAGH